MKVKACRQTRTPGYPSRVQFLAGRALVGAAAIGLGAMASRGDDPVRLRGDIAVVPAGAPPVAVQPVMPQGVIPTPRQSGATNALPPAASTNQPKTACPVPQPPGGIRAVPPIQLKGVIAVPLETK